MKKLFFFILPLIFSAPLNAQKIIKYTTFFPVPYGSHETVKVDLDYDNTNVGTSNSGKAYFNTTHPSQTKIEGTIYVEEDEDNPKVSVVEGILEIGRKANPTDPLTAIPTVTSDTASVIQTGNGAVSIRSPYVFTSTENGTTTVTNHNQPALSVVHAYDTLKLNSTLNGKNVTGLAGCSGSGTIQNLRVRGSQECRPYITCGGSGGTGCGNPNLNCGYGTDKDGYKGELCFRDNGRCFHTKKTDVSCSWFYNEPRATGSLETTVICLDGKNDTWQEITKYNKGNFTWTGTCGCSGHYEWNPSTHECDEITYSWVLESVSKDSLSNCNSGNNIDPSVDCQPEGATGTYRYEETDACYVEHFVCRKD